MKKLFFIFLSVLITIYSNVSLATAGTTNYISKKKPVFTLQLPSNPTTGYSWFIISYDANILNLIEHKYLPSKIKKDKQQMTGAGGNEIWKFRVTRLALKAPRITTVKLVYLRPWEIQKNSLPKDIQEKTIYLVIT